MPQIGESKKEAQSHPRSKTIKKKKVEEEEVDDKNEILSAYTPEGQKRIEEYEKTSRKKARLIYWLVLFIAIALLVLLIVGSCTNWFQPQSA
jgi:hypothetical protein